MNKNKNNLLLLINFQSTWSKTLIVCLACLRLQYRKNRNPIKINIWNHRQMPMIFTFLKIIQKQQNPPFNICSSLVNLLFFFLCCCCCCISYSFLHLPFHLSGSFGNVLSLSNMLMRITCDCITIFFPLFIFFFSLVCNFICRCSC